MSFHFFATLSITALFSILLCNISFAQNETASIKIETLAESGFIIFDDNFNQCTPFNNGDVISIPTGDIQIRVTYADYADSNIRISLDPDQEQTLKLSPLKISKDSQKQKLSSYARCFWGDNVFIFSDQQSTIYFEGEPIGTKHVRVSAPANNYYDIGIEMNGERINDRVYITNKLNTVHQYFAPKRSTIYKRSFVPAYAQFSKREPVKGSVIIGLSASMVASAFYFNHKVGTEGDHYNELRESYNSAQSTEELLLILQESEQSLDTIDKYKRYRTYSLIGLATTYVINIVDGFRPPKLGFRNEKLSINPHISLDKSLIPQANVSIDF